MKLHAFQIVKVGRKSLAYVHPGLFVSHRRLPLPLPVPLQRFLHWAFDVESMADAHPGFLFELLVAHQSDLRQKQQRKICVHMHESSQV